MKVQNKQRYCLLLTVIDADYETAKLKAGFYGEDVDGLWQEIVFAEGLLREYRIDQNGGVRFQGSSLESMLEEAVLRFQKTNDDETRKREEEKRRRKEWIRQQEIEAEKRREEQRKKQEAFAERQAKREEERRIAEEKAQEERRLREENFKRDLAANLDQQETLVRDPDGNRWIKCEFCGKIAMDSEFAIYGGAIGVCLNLGTCKECSANNPEVKMARIEKSKALEKKYDPNICPDCGGRLVEKNGQFGVFIGCSSFPRCRYTRSLRR